VNHPLDEEIASLINNLLPLLRERGIRHTSLFADGAPRIYLSSGSWRSEAKGEGTTPSEALAALDAALGDHALLETLY